MNHESTRLDMLRKLSRAIPVVLAVVSMSSAAPPDVAINGVGGTDPILLFTQTLDEIRLSAVGSSDPDGDTISYAWLIDEDATTYNGDIPIENATEPVAHFVVPRYANGTNIHVLLEVSDDEQPPETVQRRAIIRVRRDIAVVPLGDSITQANTEHDSYRRPLWQLLGDANVDFVGSTDQHFGGPPPNTDYDNDHEGHWGWRVDEIMASLPGWLAGYTPDVALIHLGTNDMFQNNSIEGTADELETVVQQLRDDNPLVVVLLAQLLPTSNPGDNNRVDQLNALIPGIAANLSTATSPVLVVDHNTDFDVATETYDGTHPNAAGEAKMAARWFEALAPVLAGDALVLPGDLDDDGDVDQVDFGYVQVCFSGTDVPQADPACAAARLDDDDDVDTDDLDIFLGCLSGATVPADPACAE